MSSSVRGLRDEPERVGQLGPRDDAELHIDPAARGYLTLEWVAGEAH